MSKTELITSTPQTRCFSIQNTYLPSHSHHKRRSFLPLLSQSPISHKTLSLLNQKCLSILPLSPLCCLPLTCILCQSRAPLPLVFPPCGNSLKYRSDHFAPNFKSLAGYALLIEDRIETPHSQTIRLFHSLVPAQLFSPFSATLCCPLFSESTMSFYTSMTLNASTHPTEYSS